MKSLTYAGSKNGQISFPLGGLGTGCIGLAGNGRLVDWEIFGRPNKGSVNGFSHFAVKLEAGKEVLDARVLQGDLAPPFTGELHRPDSRGFGFGPARGTLSGLPHFSETTFQGEFPIAALDFQLRGFPGAVGMTAFNPFIPLNPDDSGIPAAFFEITLKNTTRKSLRCTLAGVLSNPLPANNLHAYEAFDDCRLLHLRSDSLPAESVGYGDLCLATDAGDVSSQLYWYRGSWFDALEVYWREFSSPGKLPDRTYPPGEAGAGNHGVLAVHFRLTAGKSRTVRFLIAWNFPNNENYWNAGAVQRAKEQGLDPLWKSYYATVWGDSRDTARYALANWKRLRSETVAFKEALFDSDLPEAALEAVSASLSVLKSPTVMRLQDGTFYGWEGCCSTAGCCEGSCTHVWNYAQAQAFLFPRLERSMREADYRYNQQEDGGMPFRLQLPLRLGHPGGRSCADGLFGNVMKVYRDWKISGDTAWLARLWPQVKRSIEYAWAQSNEDRWDPKKSGVLWGRQHHTLDMELFGPNSWLTGFYLGALKAASEMAFFLGEPVVAQEYRKLFEEGKSWVDEHLFNGEYYQQDIDLENRGILEEHDAAAVYWSAEHGEVKYQIGEGCGIDQVLAQWHARMYGLGDIFDPGQTRKALRAIYRHNYRKPMRDHYNPCRVFSLNDEAGTVIAAWPEGRRRPMIPVPYAQETMTGFEYAAAAHMIQVGLVREGSALVKAIRGRFDGRRRNPWNEFECGSNYARSLASYSLLGAFSGFEFDMVEGMIGFAPVGSGKKKFQCFWSLDPAWGVFVRKSRAAELDIRGGSLVLTRLRLPDDTPVKSVGLGRGSVKYRQENRDVIFPKPVRINESQSLELTLSR